MTAAGIVLLALVPLVAIEASIYVRTGIGGEFWALPLDDKLDHIKLHLRLWWALGIVWVALLAVTLGGMTAVVWIVDETWAWIGLGGLGVAVMAWYLGITLQTAGLAKAAEERAGTGTTPSWIHPIWAVGWMCELSWVLVANIAFIAVGVAILQGDAVAAWAGWAAVALGAIITAAVVITRSAFPHLGLVVPFMLGVAVLVT